MFNIEVDDKQFTAKIDSVVSGIKEFVPALKRISEEFFDYYGNDVFDSQGAKGAGRWVPLAASTVAARATRTGYYRRSPGGGGKKILSWSGQLRAGFKDKISPNQLVFSNHVDYFKYHQTGGRGLPARPILAVTPQAEKIVKKEVGDFLETVLS